MSEVKIDVLEHPTEEELQAIINLYNRLYTSELFILMRIKEMLADNELLVARDEDEIVGFVVFVITNGRQQISPDVVTSAKVLQINEVVSGKRGVGTKMLQYLNSQYPDMDKLVFMMNPELKDFYYRCDFREVMEGSPILYNPCT